MSRPTFTDRILHAVARRSPINEAMLAADLRVTLPSVKRVVSTAIRQGLMIHVEVEGYAPHLCLTADGRLELASREPNWWKKRLDATEQTVAAATAMVRCPPEAEAS